MATSNNNRSSSRTSGFFFVFFIVQVSLSYFLHMSFWMELPVYPTPHRSSFWVKITLKF